MAAILEKIRRCCRKTPAVFLFRVKGWPSGTLLAQGGIE
jgi:hypothetical protein